MAKSGSCENLSTTNDILSAPTASEEGVHANPEIQQVYTALKTFVHNLDGEVDPSTVPSSDKLSKMTFGLLLELACDLGDEISRRDVGFPSQLLPREDMTDRRNNARSRLSSFTEKRVGEYCADVIYEMDRRNVIKPTKKTIAKKPESSTNEKRAKLTKEDLNEVASSPSVLLSKSPLPVPLVNFTSSLNSLSAANTSINMSLCAMIDDLGSIIGDEGSNDEEIEALKHRHAQEIAELKNVISRYESVSLPEKNRELSRLMSKVEEGELQISRLGRENAELKEQLAARDCVIEEQSAAYATLNEALLKIQNDFSTRASMAANRFKTAAVEELKSSPLFGELKALNGLMLTAISSMRDSINQNNTKLCLKLLRDVANAAKSSLMGFERILQGFASLQIDDIVSEGDALKSTFISSLYSLLIAGKDYAGNSSNPATLQSTLESFKSQQEAITSFQQRLESSISEL